MYSYMLCYLMNLWNMINKIRFQSLDKNGKSKVTDPLPFPNVPLKLLAYLLFRYDYSFLYNVFRETSSVMTLIPFAEFYLAYPITFMDLYVDVAFLIVSIEIASRCNIILSLKIDCPNHWICDCNLAISMPTLSLTSLKKYSTQIQ